MNADLVDILACPDCRGDMILEPGAHSNDSLLKGIESGSLRCSGCDMTYPIINGIPRFVPAENYADSFGFEWHQHATTQLDSVNGTSITRDRFERESGWSDDLGGQMMLEVGCGSGRFTEIALQTGARVVSIDYSSAVEVSAKNNGPNERLDVVQADIYALPFKTGTFDKIFCIGVLQHTPDVEGAFRSLVPLGKPGGEILVDIYDKNRTNRLQPRYYLRPLTSRLPHRLLYRMIRLAVPVLLPIKSILRQRIPVIGRYVAGVIPVANYIGAYPLTPSQHREWSVLDTFDILSPRYEKPGSISEVTAWFDGMDLEEISVWRPYMTLVAGKGRVPRSVE